MKLNWNFQRGGGGGCRKKKALLWGGGGGIFCNCLSIINKELTM